MVLTICVTGGYFFHIFQMLQANEDDWNITFRQGAVLFTALRWIDEKHGCCNMIIQFMER